MKDKGLGTACASCFGICVGAIVGLVLASLFGGFVFVTLWGWFIVPLGLPAVSIFHGLGIVTFFGFITTPILMSLAKRQEKEMTPETGLAISLLSPFLAYGLMLLMGWVYYCLMNIYPNF
jgi:hypothetical protein